MKIPAQKIVRCHKCGYTAYSRDSFWGRNLTKRPYFCGQCGSRDFIEVSSRGYHLVICLKAEDIEQSVGILAGKGKIKGIPKAFLDAFEKEEK